MRQGDQVDVTLVSGHGWHGMVAGYSAAVLRLTGEMWTWAPGMAHIEVMELHGFREVLLLWPRIEFVEVWE